MEYRKMGNTGFMPSAIGFWLYAPALQKRTEIQVAEVNLKEAGPVSYAMPSTTVSIISIRPMCIMDEKSEEVLGKALKGWIPRQGGGCR